MKHEWRKKEKDLYIPKQKPELVTVPEQKFFMICRRRPMFSSKSQFRRSRLACETWSMTSTGQVDGADLPPGFIEKLYAPRDENEIQVGDRVLSHARQRPPPGQLSASHRKRRSGLPRSPFRSASFRSVGSRQHLRRVQGLLQGSDTGVGKFGGSNGDALVRIKGRIELDVPVLSRFECDVEVYQQDANALAGQLRGLDLAYFDPPYNQHPYGSNYFMLNLLVDYQRPGRLCAVSAFRPTGNAPTTTCAHAALGRLAELIRAVDASFVLVSFNDEGFIAPDEMRTITNSDRQIRGDRDSLQHLSRQSQPSRPQHSRDGTDVPGREMSKPLPPNVPAGGASAPTTPVVTGSISPPPIVVKSTNEQKAR